MSATKFYLKSVLLLFFMVVGCNELEAGTFTINAAAPGAPSATGGSVCGSGVVTLTASGGFPGGGTYNWYAASSGGTALQSSTSTKYMPSVTATTTYYVSYTVFGSESTRTAVTAMVNVPPNLTTMPTTGAYLSYPFSGNSNDISSNADNGTVQGAAPLATDRFGNANSAYSFNGSSQYISTNKSVAAPGPQNFTTSVWFKTSTAGGLLVGYTGSQTGSAAQYDRHIYMSNSGALYFGIYVSASGTYANINTVSNGVNYADGNWHNVVAACSSTSGSTLYVDGALQAFNASMTTPETYGISGYWRIAYNNLSAWPGSPSNFYFTGSLDDIAVYTSALTASQVYTVYGAGSPPICAGNTLNLQANSLSGATYAWTGPNSFTSSVQNPVVSTAATVAMAGTYVCTVTGSNGCTSSINVTAVVNAGPASAFTATNPGAIGANSTITYSGTVSATSTYTWNFNGGTVASGSGAGPYMVNWASTGSKTISLAVTTSSGCSSTTTQNIYVGAYGNYGFSDPVTLNNTSLGISSNLTNFPVLLSIKDNNLIISGTCNDKVYYPNGPNYDFAFYDPTSASELYYQVESYNQTTGTLLVWVQVPTLTYASNQSILFSYGSTAPTVTHNTAFYAKTWAGDYLSVYHFNETAYTGTTADGTANAHTGTNNGMSTSNLVTGKIGNAYSFNGSSTTISATAGSVTGTFTISAWVNLTAAGNDQKVMTDQTGTGSISGGYKLGVYSNNIPEAESGTANNRYATPTPAAFTTGTWHYIQGVYSGTTLSTYVDGAQYGVTSTTNSPSANTTYYIGAGEGGNTYYFNGIIDEPRVSNVAKTSDWIKAEYVDQNNPTAFTSVGSTTVNSTNAAAISGALTYTWTGSTSTDPTVAANWNNTTAGTTSQLPAFNGTASIVIPAGLSNYPVLTASESIYGLTLASGASLNLNGFTLSVGCNIYNSTGGQLLYGTSTSSGLTWNGTLTTQTYTGSATANTASLANMTINNSAGGTITISGGPVDIYNTLTLTKGNLVVSASPTVLTLKSTANLTASVAALPSGSTISGTVSVERYLTGGQYHRGYRLLSSPVYAATVSSNVYSLNYLQNNVVITGFQNGGFDKTGNPTIYLFREDKVPSNSSFISGNFWGISAINNTPSYNYYLNGLTTNYNIPVGGGFMFFFRGNKASASLAAETVSTYVPVSVAVTATGTLNQGQVIARDWYTPTSQFLGNTGSGTGAATNGAVRGYNLVGNPYASSIDWETYNTSTTTTGIYAKNIGTTIYEFNDVTYNYDTYQKGGAHTNNGSNIIASGQGFYVSATSAASSQLIFNETAKTSAQNTGAGLFMALRSHNENAATAGTTVIDQHLRIQLAQDSINTDDIYISLDQTAKNEYVFNEDAAYHKGAGKVSLASMSSDGISLAINKLPLPTLGGTTIPLVVNAKADGVYKLNRTELQSIPALYEIWLMDAYTKDSLDMRNNATYAFNLALADTNSYGSKRFSLVIRQNPALMVHLLSFTASKVTQGAQVLWTTENEANYTNFTVQRSTDGGKTFTSIGTFLSSSLGSYTLTDSNPAQPSDQYRLQLTDLNGAITYSSVVTIMYSNTGNGLASTRIGIYPNPCKSTLNVSIVDPISLSGGAQKTYAIKIYNMVGILLQEVTSTDINWQTDQSSLIPGTYILKVFNKSNSSMIGQGTFIKL